MDLGQHFGDIYEQILNDRIPAAAIFWAKARMGWRDRDAIRIAESIPLGAEPQRDQAIELRAQIGNLSQEGRTALRVVLKELGAESRVPEVTSRSAAGLMLDMGDVD